MTQRTGVTVLESPGAGVYGNVARLRPTTKALSHSWYTKRSPVCPCQHRLTQRGGGAQHENSAQVKRKRETGTTRPRKHTAR